MMFIKNDPKLFQVYGSIRQDINSFSSVGLQNEILEYYREKPEIGFSLWVEAALLQLIIHDEQHARNYFQEYLGNNEEFTDYIIRTAIACIQCFIESSGDKKLLYKRLMEIKGAEKKVMKIITERLLIIANEIGKEL